MGTTGMPAPALSSFAANINGHSTTKPRQAIPYNLWAKANLTVVDAAYAQHCLIKGKPPRKKMLAVRAKITGRLFRKLPTEAQTEWKDAAEREHAEVLEERAKLFRGAPSELPCDRQR